MSWPARKISESAKNERLEHVADSAALASLRASANPREYPTMQKSYWPLSAMFDLPPGAECGMAQARHRMTRPPQNPLKRSKRCFQAYLAGLVARFFFALGVNGVG